MIDEIDRSEIKNLGYDQFEDKVNSTDILKDWEEIVLKPLSKIDDPNKIPSDEAGSMEVLFNHAWYFVRSFCEKYEIRPEDWSYGFWNNTRVTSALVKFKIAMKSIKGTYGDGTYIIESKVSGKRYVYPSRMYCALRKSINCMFLLFVDGLFPSCIDYMSNIFNNHRVYTGDLKLRKYTNITTIVDAIDSFIVWTLKGWLPMEQVESFEVVVNKIDEFLERVKASVEEEYHDWYAKCVERNTEVYNM